MLEPHWKDDCRKEHDLDFEHENPDGTLFYRCLRCWKTFHFDADDAPEK